MKKKIRKDLEKIVVSMVSDYNNCGASDEQAKVLNNLIKGINIVKELESKEIDDEIKEERLRIDLEKLELEKKRIEIENEKLLMDRAKANAEQDKFKESNKNEIHKLELDDSKLEFEKSKLNYELKKSKTDRVFNSIMKGLEIGIPLIVYGTLSVLSLKAIYKDDVRVPSETWNFIRSVSKR